MRHALLAALIALTACGDDNPVAPDLEAVDPLDGLTMTRPLDAWLKNMAGASSSHLTTITWRFRAGTYAYSRVLEDPVGTRLPAGQDTLATLEGLYSVTCREDLEEACEVVTERTGGKFFVQNDFTYVPVSLGVSDVTSLVVGTQYVLFGETMYEIVR